MSMGGANYLEQLLDGAGVEWVALARIFHRSP